MQSNRQEFSRKESDLNKNGVLLNSRSAISINDKLRSMANNASSDANQANDYSGTHQKFYTEKPDNN